MVWEPSGHPRLQLPILLTYLQLKNKNKKKVSISFKMFWKVFFLIFKWKRTEREREWVKIVDIFAEIENVFNIKTSILYLSL